MPYSDQKKGTLLAFTAIMFITPDSLFIRLADLTSWNLIFYRGFIPFLTVFVGLLIIYKTKFISQLIENGWHGIAYAGVFTLTNIFFCYINRKYQCCKYVNHDCSGAYAFCSNQFYFFKRKYRSKNMDRHNYYYTRGNLHFLRLLRER